MLGSCDVAASLGAELPAVVGAVVAAVDGAVLAPPDEHAASNTAAEMESPPIRLVFDVVT
jgi:hypothetical protein